MVQQVGNAEVGKSVRVKVFRDGKTETLMVTLGRRETAENAEAAAAAPEGTAPEEDAKVLDMTVTAMTAEIDEVDRKKSSFRSATASLR